MMSTNMENIWSYVLAHQNEDITAQDIADALEIGVKGVCGVITVSQKLGATIREEAIVNGRRVMYIRVVDEKILRRRMTE